MASSGLKKMFSQHFYIPKMCMGKCYHSQFWNFWCMVVGISILIGRCYCLLQTWGSHVWKLAKACLLLKNWSCSRENHLLHYKNKMRSLHLYKIIDDINSVLQEITYTQIETLNLTDHIHKPTDIRTKRSLLTSGGTVQFPVWNCKWWWC